MSVMVKTDVVKDSPRRLWPKPTWWLILEETPRRFWDKTDVVLLLK